MINLHKKKTRLVNLTDMTKDAHKGKYAIPHINTNNLEWIGAILDSAQSNNSPIIIGVSEGAAKYQFGFKNLVDMVNNVMEYKNITVPVSLHLDHGSYDGAIEALKAGFPSVMFDGSHYAIDENIAKTKEILKLAKGYNASVEAEVGAIGGEEDGVIGNGEVADPEECKMIADLGVAILAAGIGNVHGLYHKDWQGLRFDVLTKINAITTATPLVLHGGTGIPENQIKQAIALGVSKINVNTECQISFAQATRKYIEENKDLDIAKKGFDPRKLLKPGTDAVRQVVTDKIILFGSKDKANK